MNKNTHFNTPQHLRSDEFYTNLVDIEIELNHYRELLKGKVIFMPCDKPKYSMFWKYFYDNFESLQLKKIIATYYDADAKKTTFDGEKITEEALIGDGDVYGSEIKAIYKDIDIIITNPPFTKYKNLVIDILEVNKKFLMVAPLSNGTELIVKQFYNGHSINFGYNSVNNFKTFDKDGNETVKVIGSTHWLTNLKVIPKKDLKLTLSYDKEKAEHFDENNYLNVNRLKDIPYDYYGVMGVPVTISQRNYEMYFEPLIKVFRGHVNNKVKFTRVLIKRKKK